MTEIVLIGGGHAHVHVVKAFGARPIAGTRVTLIARDVMATYSGMLPGVIAGLYRAEQAQIDLARLAASAGATLVHGEAVGRDRAAKKVLLAGGGSLAYDLLSIDVGISPDIDAIPGAAAHAIAVKPIGEFLAKFEYLRGRCRAGTVRHIVVIGGGAAGVELVLSLQARLRADAAGGGGDPEAISFVLVTAEEMLATHNARVRAAFRKILASRGIVVHAHRPVAAVAPDHVRLADGAKLAADASLLATGAAAPVWLRATGLACDARGFLAVRPSLQVDNDPDVFAAGDCVSLMETPREKSGVYAVRAGPPLAGNLRRRASGEATKPWRPQRRHLALISTGERYAVASRGAVKAEGAWVWTLKDWIDRRWMAQYQL